MKRAFAIAVLLIALSAACGAEARWCAVTGRGPNDNFEYPDIARRAHLFGVVKAGLTFLPGGAVRSITHISGPPLLFALMKEQLIHWTIKTDAQNDQPCQTEVIAEFDLGENAQWRSGDREKVQAPTVLKLKVDSEPYPVETNVWTIDPVIRPSVMDFFRYLGCKLKHCFGGTPAAAQ